MSGKAPWVGGSRRCYSRTVTWGHGSDGRGFVLSLRLRWAGFGWLGQCGGQPGEQDVEAAFEFGGAVVGRKDWGEAPSRGTRRSAAGAGPRWSAQVSPALWRTCHAAFRLAWGVAPPGRFAEILGMSGVSVSVLVSGGGDVVWWTGEASARLMTCSSRSGRLAGRDRRDLHGDLAAQREAP
jgi:hypothetical protein